MAIIWSKDVLWCSILFISVVLSILYTIVYYWSVQDGGSLLAMCTAGVSNNSVPSRKLLLREDLIYM